MSSLLSSTKSLRKVFLGLFVFFCLVAISACGSGNSAQVYDSARVLNTSQVRSAASQLPKPVAIYTTNTFQGNQADFQRAAIQKLNGNPNTIVMAIDTAHRYIYIARGSNVQLSGAGVNQAVSAFSTSFNNGNYTNASLAALNSLQGSLGSSARTANRGGASFSPVWLCCIIPVLLILGGVLFGASRRGQGRGMPGGLGRGPAPYRPTMSPDNYDPYNNQQGPYYGPPQQRGGMNPWAAGGLGAAAGGLAGYELGKRQGEYDSEQNPNYGDPGNLGGGGSFGGDDAGFGNSDSGAGGSFGGGGFDNGDLGGGGSFGGDDVGGGGSFGNSDFGGGGSFGNDDFGQGDDAGGGNF
jgi:hypothetical protein